MPGSQPYDVFISHSAGDEAWISEFVDTLTSEGMRVWFDTRDIAPGDRWQDKIEEALRESRAVVFLIGPDTKDEGYSWASFELGAAFAGNKKIIPVAIKDIEQKQIPKLFRHLGLLKEASPQAAGKRVAKLVTQM